ncbi:unnamed protein product, partial [Urochloa humidicola]
FLGRAETGASICLLQSSAAVRVALILGPGSGLSRSPLFSDPVGVRSCMSTPTSLALGHRIVPACAAGVLFMCSLLRCSFAAGAPRRSVLPR